MQNNIDVIYEVWINVCTLDWADVKVELNFLNQFISVLPMYCEATDPVIKNPAKPVLRRVCNVCR